MLVVVDFAVDSEGEGARVIEERLVAGFDVDDGEALVREDVTAFAVDARPIGTAVAEATDALEDARTDRIRAAPNTEDTEDAAHRRKVEERQMDVLSVLVGESEERRVET